MAFRKQLMFWKVKLNSLSQTEDKGKFHKWEVKTNTSKSFNYATWDFPEGTASRFSWLNHNVIQSALRRESASEYKYSILIPRFRKHWAAWKHPEPTTATPADSAPWAKGPFLPSALSYWLWAGQMVRNIKGYLICKIRNRLGNKF